MFNNIKMNGEIEPIKIDYINKAVGLFRVRITSPERIDINHDGIFHIRLYSLGTKVQYKDVVFRVVSSNGIKKNATMHEILRNSCTDISCCIKVVDDYAYFYAKTPNSFEALTYQVLFAPKISYLEPLEGVTITKEEFNDNTNTFRPIAGFFEDVVVTYDSNYAKKTNDSQAENVAYVDYKYIRLNLRTVITSHCPANTPIITLSRIPVSRKVTFWADVITGYDNTKEVTRKCFEISTNGELYCLTDLVATDNVFIDTIYEFRRY